MLRRFRTTVVARKEDVEFNIIKNKIENYGKIHRS